MPERYGSRNAVYKCFAKWQEQGLFEKIFKKLAIDCDLQDISIDSTIIKMVALKKKKHTTKIYAALGNPLKIILTGGQVQDVTIAQELIAGIKADIVCNGRWST